MGNDEQALLKQLGLAGLDQLTPAEQQRQQQVLEQQARDEADERRRLARERLDDPYLAALRDGLFGPSAAGRRLYASPAGQTLFRRAMGKEPLDSTDQQLFDNLRNLNRQRRQELDSLPDISPRDALYRPIDDILTLPLRLQKAYVKKLVALTGQGG